MIGGNGEQKTLRLVARYGDACNLMVATPADVAHKLGVLAEHCEREGRDGSSITRTVTYVADPFADVDEFVDRARSSPWALGVDEIVPDGDRQDPLADVRVACA